MPTKKYIIYRRNDGHVDCSLNTLPADWVTGGAEPEFPGGPRIGAGEKVTFEQLGEFDTFAEAYEFAADYLKQHPESDSLYECSLCHKRFRTAQELSNHNYEGRVQHNA